MADAFRNANGGVDVVLRFTADGSALTREIDRDIKALEKFAETADVTNKVAVSAFRANAAAERERLQDIGATAEQFRKLDAMTRTFEKSALAANSATNLAGRGARTGGRAFAALAFDVDSASTSARGAVNAFGNLAYGIASTAKEGSYAATNAGGIFVLVTLLGVLADKATAAYHALHDGLAEGSITSQQSEHIKNISTLAEVQRETALTEAHIAAAQQKLNSVKAPAPANETRAEARYRRQHAADIDQAAAAKQIADLYELKNKIAERGYEIASKAGDDAKRAAEKLAQQIAEDARKGADLQRKLGDDVLLVAARNEGAFQRRDQAAEKLYSDEVARIHTLTTLNKKSQDELLGLAFRRRALTKEGTAEELAALREKMRLETTVGAGEEVATFRAHLKLIELEKAARIKAGWEVATANQKAEQETDALRKQYAAQQLAAITTIADVMIASNNRTVHEIGKGFQAIRKVVMAYKAAENLVEGLKLTGQALGLASLGDPGAAAAWAGAAQHFAASAVAAGEALGGGGGGGRGGGGGGGGATGPRDSSRLGSGQGASGNPLQRLEIVFIKQDQDGKELARTRQRLDRLSDRNQPIRAAL